MPADAALAIRVSLLALTNVFGRFSRRRFACDHLNVSAVSHLLEQVKQLNHLHEHNRIKAKNSWCICIQRIYIYILYICERMKKRALAPF